MSLAGIRGFITGQGAVLNAYLADIAATPGLLQEELALWLAQRREQRRWEDAPDFASLCELSAQFCEGKLDRTPDHMGPRMPETVRIGDPLAHANRNGFLTTGSQPGQNDPWAGGHIQQRAVVEGWASPETAERLERLIAGSRLRIQVSEQKRWRVDYSRAFEASRYIYPDGSVRVETEFGFIPSETTPFIDFGRGDLVDESLYVTIHDPEWGDHSLLWRRLSAPDWDNPPPLADEDRAMPETVPTDEEVEHLDQSVAEAFAHSDRLFDVWQVRYERDQNVQSGDLAAALQGDDWLEDHGMHGDDRATCHTCQSWADHAHDPITGRRITTEEYEQRQAMKADNRKWLSDLMGREHPIQEHPIQENADGDVEIVDSSQGPQHTADSRYTAAELPDPTRTAPTRPVPDRLADVAREWLSELQFQDVEPEDFDDHDFITDEEVLRAAGKAYDGGLPALARDLWEPEQAPAVSTSAPRDATSPLTTQGATRMPLIDWIHDYWDMFFAWLFDWGQEDPKYLSDGQAVNRKRARNIAASVDAKLTEQRARAAIPPPDVATVPQDADTRPQPAPQDLDAIAAGPPPPRTSAKFRPPPPKPQLNAWSRHEQDWCSCEGNAHDARCRFTVRSLGVSFPSPPNGVRGGASTEPAPPTQP